MSITTTVELGLGGSFFAAVRSEPFWKYWRMTRATAEGGPNSVQLFTLVDTAGAYPLFGNADTLTIQSVGSAARDLPGTIPDGGLAITLDGAVGFLESVAADSFPGTGPATYEVVLTINAAPGSGGIEPAIMGGGAQFGLTYRSDGRVYAYHNGSSWTNTAVATGSRVHLVMTRAGTSPNDLITLYVNGTSVGSTTPARVTLTPTTWLHFGKHWTNAHYLSATYEFAAVYPVALSAARVSAHYAALTWTDVTQDTRGAIPLVIERGIRSDSPAQRVASTGTLTFAMNNLASNSGGVTGYYSPGHASCRAGFGKGIPVRVRDGSDVLFHGRVRKIAPTPGKMSGVYTSVMATDFMETAATFLLDGIPAYEDVTAGQVFERIVTTMPNKPNGITVYQGSEVYPLALDNTRDEALSALQEFARIANSELGYIYVNRKGTLVHESRTTRPANNGEAQVTLADTMHGLDVAEVANTALNRVQLTVHPRVIDSAATTVLWTLVNPLEIGAGKTNTLIGPYRTADAPGITTRVGGLDMVTPVSTTDYTMNDASDGSGTDRTASLDVTANFGANGVQMVVTNNHTGRAYITKLQCRGKGVYDFRTVVVRAQDDAAIAADGVNALTIDMPYQEDPNVAQALADDLLTAYGDLSGSRATTVTMIPDAAGMPADLHLYDISDRVAVSETITGATGEYWINGVRLECQSGRLATLKWWLAPTGFPVAWTSVAWASGNFTATGGGSWTVNSNDQTEYAYTVSGKTMTLAVWVTDSSVSGTVNTLNIAIPGGYVANRNVAGYAYLLDNGTYSDGNVRADAGGTVVKIGRGDNGNFAASTNNTQVRLTITFEVQ